MPKQKHNKLQKKNKVGSADFKKNFETKKKKQKVGKGRVAAANATSTEVSARALAMPHSSILRPGKEDRVLVTQRNLSLDELLVQTRHVNAGVRRDALGGLRELISQHGAMLRVRMSDILGRAVELLLDSDQATRQALLLLLGTAFQQISERIIDPFLELLVVYINSAIAHSTPSMRLDAMGALRVTIEAYPKAIAPRLGGLLPPLFQLLSAAEGDKNNRLERRMTMLRTLFLTLQCVAGAATPDASSQTGGADARWTATGTRGIEVFSPSQSLTAGSGTVLAAVALPKTSGSEKAPLEEVKAFVPELLPQVWQCWLECCPSNLADRARHAHDLLLIVRLLLQLFRPTTPPQSGQPSGLGLPVPSTFVAETRRHLLVHCPLRPGADGSEGTVPVLPDQRGAEGVATVLAAVDVAVCELIVLVAAGGNGGDSQLAKSKSKRRSSDAPAPDVWYKETQDMIMQLLRDESAGTALRGVAAADGIAAFDTAGRLVHVASALVRVTTPTEATAIWEGLTALFKRSRRAEVVQRHIFALWTADPDAVPRALRKDWLLVLFRLLWELQTSDETLTLAILSSVLECLRRRRRRLVLGSDQGGTAADMVLGSSGENAVGDAVEKLHAAIIPFFCQRTATRKRRQSSPAKPGAWTCIYPIKRLSHQPL